jgi:ribosomal protein L23
MRLLVDKIFQPLMSEKSSKMEMNSNEFTLVVDSKMTKEEIKRGVEALFGTKPLNVRTSVFRKRGKRAKGGRLTQPKLYKKAIVRLPEGKRIEFK